MKARVKETGEIVEVDFHMETQRGKMFGEVTDSRRLCKPDMTYRKFYRDEIEFLSYEDTPDYWTRLEHQYAGMAMQGVIAHYGVEPLPEDAAHDAYNYAHALVEMMKEVRK